MAANDELIIREARSSDSVAIASITRSAFEHSPHSDQQEYLIIDALRSSGALNLGLIALVNEEIVGFAATSPVQISDGTERWYGLGPIAILPKVQRKGVGSMLVDEILHRLRIQGAEGCVVLGEPDFYCRFGFEPDPSLSFADFDPELFQCIRFNANTAQGEVTYHPAFYSQN